MNCQQLVELVTDYLDGALDPTAKRRFEAHLDACDGCSAYLAQMHLTLRLLGEIPIASLDRHARDRLLDAFRGWPRIRHVTPGRFDGQCPCERGPNPRVARNRGTSCPM